MSAAPVFVVSLDFELHWGGVEKWNLQESYFQQYFAHTRRIIPEMLRLFSEHEVKATWATVGMLFFDQREEMESAFPALRPSYLRPELSSYHYISQSGIGRNEQEDPYNFGLSLIRQVQSTPGMEIGSHTFSHFYADAPGQDAEQFRADLRAARQAAERLDIELRSLVMPRNQVRSDYLDLIADEGFTSVRVNPADWYWKNPSEVPENLWKRANRFADAFVSNGVRKSFPQSSMVRRSGEPLQIPASRFLRPHDRRFGPLNNLRIQRILREMTGAATAGEVYHLWWHPHNFGRCPEESLNDLRCVLEHFTMLRERHGMQSLTMGDLAAAFK